VAFALGRGCVDTKDEFVCDARKVAEEALFVADVPERLEHQRSIVLAASEVQLVTVEVRDGDVGCRAEPEGLWEGTLCCLGRADGDAVHGTAEFIPEEPHRAAPAGAEVEDPGPTGDVGVEEAD
jgi:hypothetical protein